MPDCFVPAVLAFYLRGGGGGGSKFYAFEFGGGGWWWWWLQVASQHCIKADVRIFNAAINACAQAGEVVRAMLLFEGMPERQLAPDIITYNALINASWVWSKALRSQPLKQ